MLSHAAFTRALIRDCGDVLFCGARGCSAQTGILNSHQATRNCTCTHQEIQLDSSYSRHTGAGRPVISSRAVTCTVSPVHKRYVGKMHTDSAVVGHQWTRSGPFGVAPVATEQRYNQQLENKNIK